MHLAYAFTFIVVFVVVFVFVFVVFVVMAFITGLIAALDPDVIEVDRGCDDDDDDDDDADDDDDDDDAFATASFIADTKDGAKLVEVDGRALGLLGLGLR